MSLRAIKHFGGYLIADAYPAAAFGPIRIFVSCEHYVSGAARELLDSLGMTASKQGVSLLLVSSMAQQSN
jgi:hypothetical protein